MCLWRHADLESAAELPDTGPLGFFRLEAPSLCSQQGLAPTRPQASASRHAHQLQGWEPEGRWPGLLQGSLRSGEGAAPPPQVSQPGAGPRLPPRTPDPAGSAAPPGSDLPGSGAPADGLALQAGSGAGPRD